MFRLSLASTSSLSALPAAAATSFPHASSLPSLSTAAVLLHSFRLGTSQLTGMPASTTRKPTGMHRGPSKRQVSTWENVWWKYIKRWEHQMEGDWDVLEKFQNLPKPKKLMGNEACEIVWPYAVLLENIIKIHPFTKSVYVYYPQHALTGDGASAAHLAKRFSRECLVPICFHNSQCYVETEMLLEHGDTAWIVVHCLDGRHEIVCVNNVLNDLAEAKKKEKEGSSSTQDDEKVALLRTVLQTASHLGSTVKAPSDLMLQLNQRPLQNAFIRVDYQWMADTPEERQSHLVRWIDPDERGTQPMMYKRDEKLADWLNSIAGRGHDPEMRGRLKRANNRKPNGANAKQMAQVSALASSFNNYTRISPQWGRAAGGVAAKP